MSADPKDLNEPLLRHESWYDDSHPTSPAPGPGRSNDESSLPSWLRPENDAAHAASVSGTSGAGDNTSWADDDDAAADGGLAGAAGWLSGRRRGGTDGGGDDLPRIILGMRIANMGAAIALMASSIFAMQGLTLSLSQWVLAGYATCAGLLVCCLETQLKFLRNAIASNFGFLFDPTLRLLFYLLTASMTWGYHHVLGDAVAIYLVVVAVLNTYVLCRYPSYGETRDRIAEEEDGLLERRIRGEIAGRAVQNVVEADWI